MKVDLRSRGVAGIDVQSPMSGESNPAQFLEYQRAHGGASTRLAARCPRRAHMRYEGSIDLHQIAQSLPESERGAAQAQLRKLASQIGPPSIPSKYGLTTSIACDASR
jgi:hypothetical protein